MELTESLHLIRRCRTAISEIDERLRVTIPLAPGVDLSSSTSLRRWRDSWNRMSPADRELIREECRAGQVAQRMQAHFVSTLFTEQTTRVYRKGGRHDD